MSYPIQLFRKGGPYGRGARSYSVAGAADAGQAEALIEKGWHVTLDQALGATQVAAHTLVEEVSPRAELEAKATDLGIEFRSNWKDETIAKKIREALA